MKIVIKFALFILFSLTIINCRAQEEHHFSPTVVYKSDDLIITQISTNSYQHTTFLKTQDFGKVPCNGVIVTNNNEAIIFDTTTDKKSSEELIKWIIEKLHYKIKALIPTHFHSDCLAGLPAFDDHNIPSYAYFKTIELAKENNFSVPKNSFEDSLILKVGKENVIAKFMGEGHTKDNIVVYFPSEKILFGGCLIKELHANKGYLGDSNINSWSNTVENIKKEYPNVEIVIPGHGKPGNKDLLDYTINLFKTR
jgi:metallo-beta-lactamase class B